MRIVQEGVFGPVCAIIKFEGEEDVLRQANDTFYGLAAAAFTKDRDRTRGEVKTQRYGVA